MSGERVFQLMGVGWLIAAAVVMFFAPVQYAAYCVLMAVADFVLAPQFRPDR